MLQSTFPMRFSASNPIFKAFCSGEVSLVKLEEPHIPPGDVDAPQYLPYAIFSASNPIFKAFCSVDVLSLSSPRAAPRT